MDRGGQTTTTISVKASVLPDLQNSGAPSPSRYDWSPYWATDLSAEQDVFQMPCRVCERPVAAV